MSRSLLGKMYEEKSYNTNPYPKGFAKVTVPEGKSGDWRIERFTVNEADVGIFNLRLIRDGMARRIVPPGQYTRLMRRGTIVMSDTPAECHEHAVLYQHARGNVLINGLGLGVGLQAILTKPEVEQVTIIEKSEDVLKLVAQHVTDKRVTVIHADALEWRPAKGVRFNAVWHDIWDNVMNSDDKPVASKLRRAYGKICDWQWCWSQEYARLSS